jgi:threonine/homoserine/homoserine lactone efflux protein
LLSYVLQAALITATPGADVILALATTLASGHKAGFAAVAGMASGYLVHAVLAAIGIAVLLAGSPGSIRIVEFFGAAYLAWAGVTQIVRRNAPAPEQRALVEPYKRGFLTSLLNPKGALFFVVWSSSDWRCHRCAEHCHTEVPANTELTIPRTQFGFWLK